MTTEHDDPLPPYAFVPGGPWPHPTRSPLGHSHSHSNRAEAIGDDDWQSSLPYRRGTVLFNAGYYWEAHEAWESLWHAQGRRGATADLLKALIKLAAAGVKVREGQPHGVRTHARRAAVLLETVRAEGKPTRLGIDLDEWIGHARQIADEPPTDPAPPGQRVSRVFSHTLTPR